MRELSIRRLWYVGLRIAELQLIACLQTLTTALYALATHPEYAETLRDEVESIIYEEGLYEICNGKDDQARQLCEGIAEIVWQPKCL